VSLCVFVRRFTDDIHFKQSRARTQFSLYDSSRYSLAPAGMDGEGIVACRLQACVQAGSSERDILYSPLHGLGGGA
jgi:hypothetical protein